MTCAHYAKPSAGSLLHFPFITPDLSAARIRADVNETGGLILHDNAHPV